MLPVTTTSEEARHHFHLGRHAAFNYQARQAWTHLDSDIEADPGFVLETSEVILGADGDTATEAGRYLITNPYQDLTVAGVLHGQA